MAIRFDEKQQIFYLNTPNSSYIMGVFEEKYLLHLHWGGRVDEIPGIETGIKYLWPLGFSATDVKSRNCSTNELPQEYPTFGSADFRYPAFHAVYKDGSTVSKLFYAGYKIENGKPSIPGLPAVYTNSENEAETLTITLKDDLTGVSVDLRYTVFNNCDVITRSAVINNGGKDEIKLLHTLSAAVDFENKDFDLLTLRGAWAQERRIEKAPLMHGMQLVDSRRGASSHQENPFMALMSKNATETAGEVFGFSFVYSGNFTAGCEVSQTESTRAFIGINPFNSGWILNAGESFYTPEAVMVYSESGLGAMSRTYHKLYRENLCRGKYKNSHRPILINNWEATYFDFNEEKILDIAKKAKEIGVELLVLDDGWFGKRDMDNCSLGDWYPDTKKLPDGVKGLSEKIEAMGLKFGLWFEPEMISPDSDLYRAHPDWCIHVDGRERTEGRSQLILDYSRKEVRDYIIETLSGILGESKISYVKWDMNRHMTEVGSASLDPQHQCELYHRYILGLYEVLETLVTKFNNVLFESCSGGGGRFDPGMLYYMPQVWTSDDTDAIERCYIQHGTSIVYPPITMGAHISAVPNHQVRRITPMKTRGDVASIGQFGFELDLNKLSDEDIKQAKASIEQFKKIRDTIHFGDMYRIKSPYESDVTVWEFVSADKNEVVVISCGKLRKVFNNSVCRLCGLEESAMYEKESTGEKFSGNALMNMGYFMGAAEDFESKVEIFKKIK